MYKELKMDKKKWELNLQMSKEHTKKVIYKKQIQMTSKHKTKFKFYSSQ